MISGTATLITVESASVRKMPGASARTTSQGWMVVRWGERPGAAPVVCSSEPAMRRVYPVTTDGEPLCGWGSIRDMHVVTSSPRSTALPRSGSPSRGTTSACRSAPPATSCRAAARAGRTWRRSCSSRWRWTTASLDEAARVGARVVVSHHPLIFDPLESLSDDTEAGRLALRAAREGVAVIAAHTSLDKARGGMADVIAELLGLEAVQPLQPAAADVLKLVGFVPEDDADLVRKALFAAGAGVIGEYEHCSWSVGGQGTFFGGEATSPAAGAAGRDETVSELRLEVVFPRRLRRRVTGAYVAAHPYEEPAFDIVPLENEVASLGLGRLGVLPAPATLAALAADVAAVLRLPSVRYAGDGAREVRRVAVLPGSGAEAIARGVAQVADVLVTGDVKYHEARAAQAQGLALIDAPHGVTEQEGVLRWAGRLADALGPGATVETFRDPSVAIWSESSGAPAATGSPVAPARSAPSAPLATTPPAPGRDAGAATAQAAVPEPAAPAAPAAVPTVAARPANRDDDRYRLYTDGGARGNPGPAGIGARLMTAGGDVVEDLADLHRQGDQQRRRVPGAHRRPRGRPRPGSGATRRVPRQRARREAGQRPVQGQGRRPEAVAPAGLRPPQQVPRGGRAARAARAERRRRRARQPGDRRRDQLEVSTYADGRQPKTPAAAHPLIRPSRGAAASAPALTPPARARRAASATRRPRPARRRPPPPPRRSRPSSSKSSSSAPRRRPSA